jgi:hypothetical protein
VCWKKSGGYYVEWVGTMDVISVRVSEREDIITEG